VLQIIEQYRGCGPRGSSPNRDLVGFRLNDATKAQVFVMAARRMNTRVEVEEVMGSMEMRRRIETGAGAHWPRSSPWRHHSEDDRMKHRDGSLRISLMSGWRKLGRGKKHKARYGMEGTCEVGEEFEEVKRSRGQRKDKGQEAVPLRISCWERYEEIR